MQQSFVKFFFSVFAFPLIILALQKKVGNPIKINKTLPQKFLGIPAKVLRKKNKTCLDFELRFVC